MAALPNLLLATNLVPESTFAKFPAAEVVMPERS
jgi:hypothetical protein